VGEGTPIAGRHSPHPQHTGTRRPRPRAPANLPCLRRRPARRQPRYQLPRCRCTPTQAVRRSAAIRSDVQPRQAAHRERPSKRLPAGSARRRRGRRSSTGRGPPACRRATQRTGMPRHAAPATIHSATPHAAVLHAATRHGRGVPIVAWRRRARSAGGRRCFAARACACLGRVLDEQQPCRLHQQLTEAWQPPSAQSGLTSAAERGAAGARAAEWRARARDRPRRWRRTWRAGRAASRPTC
jgi:hypothetical protein